MIDNKGLVFIFMLFVSGFGINLFLVVVIEFGMFLLWIGNVCFWIISVVFVLWYCWDLGVELNKFLELWLVFEFMEIFGVVFG